MSNRVLTALAQRKVGQPFHPWKAFKDVILLPCAILPLQNISCGAKLTYGRLLRYAGPDGRCYPAVSTLAAELGVSARQIRRYLAELEEEKLVRRVRKVGTTNSFEFLWHPRFERPRRSRPEAGRGVRSVPVGRIRQSPPDRSVTQREWGKGTDDVQPEEGRKGDLDYLSRFARIAKASTDDPDTHENTAEYGRLKKALTEYMEGDAPSDRLVVDVMNAARRGDARATEGDVVEYLWYLYDQRGLRPGTKHGPHYWSWFKTVVHDYFRQWRDREAVASLHAGHPPGSHNQVSKQERARLEAMHDVLELPDSGD